MKHYLTILRPLNGVMSAVAMYIGSIVAGIGFYPSFAVVLGMIIVFLISSAGMIVNDIFDMNIDKTNRPDRPLPSGKMSKKFAYGYSIMLFLIGNLAALAFLSTNALYVTLLATVLLILYNSVLKKTIMIGHLVVSLLVGLTFVYGGVIAGNYFPVLILGLLAFLSNTGRELYKTIEDALGDRKHHVKNVTLKYGAHTSRKLGNLFIAVAVVLSIVPYLTDVFGKNYLIVVVIADIIFISATALPVKYSSKLCKAAMLVSLAAFVVGAYFA